ncbi:LysE family transporter [Testudinibacter sp. P80/BLE/0925]
MFALLTKLFFIHLFALASPGPDFFFVIRKAVAENQRSAVLGILGIVAALCIWLLASLLGLSILFKLYPPIEIVMLLLGGGYLGYLGSLMLRTQENIKLEQITANAAAVKSHDDWINFRQGFLVNLSNPKAMIYFGGIFSLVIGSINGYGQAGIVALMILIESFVYFYLVSRIFSHRKVKSFYLNYSRYIDNISGVVFIGFGLLLWYNAYQLVIN